MSSLLTAEQLCEQALQMIGAFPTSETSADAEDMRRASTWLDLNMAQFAGETRVWWLVTSTLNIDLAASTPTYDLETVMGAGWPADGFLFPVEAWLEDSASPANRYPLEIVIRYDIEDKTKPQQSGTPYQIHIDRRAGAKTLTVYPVPAVATWNIKLIVQTFGRPTAPGGVSGIAPAGANDHGIRETWQRWMIYQLAVDLGSGPVRRLSRADRDGYEQKADKAKKALLAFENREHETSAPVCDPYDPSEYPVGHRRGPHSDYGNLY